MGTPMAITPILDELSLPVSALQCNELWESLVFSDFTPGYLLCEVIEPQMNNRYKTTLRLSRLIEKNVLVNKSCNRQ